MSEGDYNKKIGRVLRQLREERGINQETFADSCKINRTYYGKLERGENSPTVDKLSSCAASLKIPLSDIIQRAEKLGD